MLKANEGLKTLLPAIGLASLATVGLFYFMSVLVSRGKDLNRSDDTENFIEFVRVRPQDNLETRQRKLPEKPPEPKTPPKMEQMKTSTPQPTKNLQAMNMPKLEAPLAFGDGAFVGGVGGGSSDRGVTPMVRIEPQYPRKAAMEGTEGWVRLQFDITEMGTVDNVRILEANPPRVFDSSARQALLKWRYKPQMEDGKPVRLNDQKVQLDFNLSGK